MKDQVIVQTGVIDQSNKNGLCLSEQTMEGTISEINYNSRALCPPAAASSRARLTLYHPFTSAKSRPEKHWIYIPFEEAEIFYHPL